MLLSFHILSNKEGMALAALLEKYILSPVDINIAQSQ